MALGDTYTDEEVDSALGSILPAVNANRPERPLDRATVRSILMTENMGKGGAVTFANLKGDAGETGVAQVKPSTIRALKQQKILAPEVPEDLTDAPLPVQILAGVGTLAEISDRRKTTDPTILAAEFNGGPNAGASLLNGQLPNPQVQAYLAKFGSAMKVQKPDYIPPSGIAVANLPTPVAVPLAAAQGAFTDFKALTASVTDALGVQRSTLANAAPVIATGIRVAGDAAAESARQAAEVAISGDVTHAAIMNALGLDVRDPDSAIRQELLRKAEAQKSMQPLRSQITNFQSVSFLENPLQFIMNIPAWQQTAAQFNQFADTSDQADNNIKELQAIGNNAKSLTPALAADAIRAKAHADAVNALAVAQTQLGNAQINSAAGIAKANLDELMVRHQIFQGQLQLESTEIQKKIGLAGLEDRETLLHEKLQKILGDENIAAIITQGRTMLNGKVPPTTVADLNRMDSKQRAGWEGFIQRGNFGNNYSESIPFISTYGNKGVAADSQNAPMMQQVAKIERTAIDSISSIQNEYKKKNPLGGTMKRDDALYEAYGRLYERDSGVAIPGGDKSQIAVTPYAINYDAVLSKATAEKVTGNSVIDALSYWKGLNPNKPILGTTTDTQILDTVAGNVIAGKVDPKLAAQQVAEFYKSMSHDTYMAGGLSYIGLPELKDYTVSPKAVGNKRVDLMNATQVENYLTSQIAQSKRANTDFGSIRANSIGLFN